MIEYRILGPLEVRVDGRPIGLGGARQRSVLALLLLRANSVVSTDAVVDELWGERPPPTAVKSVQVQVARLRKTLGSAGSAVVTQPPGYLLQVEPSQLDLNRFERLLEEARASEAPRAAELLREALALWRGPALADLAYEPFMQTAAARLEELRLAALDERIAADLELGRHAELVPELESLVGAQPLRERLHAQLMLALYRSGRQADALEVYRRARRTLVEELGIEPGPELRRLEAAILAQDAALEGPPPVRSAGPPPGRPAGPPFVGRESELAWLRGAIEDAFDGRGSVLLVSGEAGIGKSRLADELAQLARRRGARVAWGRCWEAGGAPAYWPWVQSLRVLVRGRGPERLREEVGSGGPELAELLPELREALPELPPRPARDPESARFWLFDAVSGFLRRSADREPVVLVLDDMHVADEPSLLMFRFLAPEVAEGRLVVLGAFRDAELSADHPLRATLAELARVPAVERLRLEGLTAADVSRYVELAAGGAPPEAVADAIHVRTEGNALFVAETVRLLTAEGALHDAEAVARAGVPEGLREVLRHRLDRLSERCREALRIASVFGREFRRDALEAAQPPAGTGTSLLPVVEEALAAGVVTLSEASPGSFRFTHVLVREALYDELGVSTRVELHRRAGEALEALYAEDLEPHSAELALHFGEAAGAGEIDRAVRYARLAGDCAVRVLAFEEAIRLYELALRTLEAGTPAPALRCELLVALGDAQARSGDMRAAEQTFLSAAELAERRRLTEAQARAALGYGGRFVWARAAGDPHLVPLLERALDTLPEGDSPLRTRLVARLSGALRDRPSQERPIALSGEAVEMARRLGDRSTLAFALDARCTAIWSPDTVEERVAVATELVHLGEEIGEPERALQGHVCRLMALVELGDGDAIDAEVEAIARFAAELGQPAQRWVLLATKATLALAEGRYGDAEAAAEEALRCGRRAQSKDAELSARLVRLSLGLQRGPLDGLAEMLQRSIDEYPWYPMLRCAQTLVQARAGKGAAARASFERFAAGGFAGLPRDVEWTFGMSFLAEVAHALGDAPRAARLHRLLRPYERLCVIDGFQVVRGSIARYLGLLAATMGRPEQAERHFERALTMNARMGLTPWVEAVEEDRDRLVAGQLPGAR